MTQESHEQVVDPITIEQTTNANEITTTPEHFNKFKKAVLHFQNRLGLFHWNIFVAHAVLEEDFEGSYATCSFTIKDGQCSTITLNKKWSRHSDWEDRDIEKKLVQTAFHEVLHLLLVDIEHAAYWDDLSNNQRKCSIDRSIHRVIRTFETVVLPLFENDLKSNGIV